MDVEWSFPAPTHSRDELLFQQWISGEYWERHRIAKRHRPERPSGFEVKTDGSSLPLHLARPWRTVRDALADLPMPSLEAPRIANHRFQPGARPYPGHTGSALDWSAKTLKAGVHGVPGGENMVVMEDGSVRYFSVREAARLQTFPDEYVFPGAWSENMRQLGNAVPVTLGEAVSRNVKSKLLAAQV